jgi:hypothetical protein
LPLCRCLACGTQHQSHPKCTGEQQLAVITVTLHVEQQGGRTDSGCTAVAHVREPCSGAAVT